MESIGLFLMIVVFGIAIVIESSRGCSDILALDKEYNRTLKKADDMLQEMQKQANNTPKNNK